MTWPLQATIGLTSLGQQIKLVAVSFDRLSGVDWALNGYPALSL